MVIYCITCIPNSKIYIGSTINFKKRKREHFSYLQKNKHHNKKLQSAFNKYGVNNFRIDIIEVIEETDFLILREQYFIDGLAPFFNINKIANSSLGLKRSKETRDKIRKANLGLVHPEWRNKLKSIAQGGDNHWTKSKNFSSEAKLNMSNSQKELYKNGYISPVTKEIYQLSLEGILIKKWNSATQVEKDLGISRKAIVNCLINKCKTSNNFIWLYV